MSAYMVAPLSSLILVEGEKAPKLAQEVLLDGEVARMSFTNFRVLFELASGVLISVPLCSIIYIVSKASALRASSSITLQMRGLHSFVISSRCPDKLHKSLVKQVRVCKTGSRCYLSPLDNERLRVLDEGEFITSANTTAPLSPFEYFTSLSDSPLDTRWRRTDINSNYHAIPLYPNVLYVPQGIKDKTLQVVAASVEGGRLPVLCWSSLVDRTSIFRGAVLPEKGVDVLEYWSAIKAAAHPHTVQSILVEGSSASSSIALYLASEGELSELLEAISSQHLQEPFTPTGATEISRWERRVRNTLNSAKAISNMIKVKNQTVVLQSNSQGGTLAAVSALSQFIVDARFRTIQGFCALIEKEFVHFGFPFIVKGDSSRLERTLFEKCGGFILFLDCVWTFISQFKAAFQFSKELIIFLFDALSCGIYDTFGSSCEKERKLDANPHSLWDYVLRNTSLFDNPSYCPVESTTLLQRWGGLFSTHWNSWILQRKLGFIDFHHQPIPHLEQLFNAKQEDANLQSYRLCYIHRDWLPLMEYLYSIDLSQNYLTEIPTELFTLPHLLTLVLCNNQINKIPLDNLPNATKLNKLLLDHNCISYVPPSWRIPKSLQSLSLRHNQIRSFTVNEPMTHLLEIGLSNNEMEEFSLQAPKLRHLSLRSNQFRKPPECLGDLASLTSLDISANPLTSFPPSLAFLESLVALDISQIPLDTQIPSLQTSVFRLVALKSLSMSSCFTQSVALPPLKNLENLVSLDRKSVV